MLRAYKRDPDDDLVGEWPISGLALRDMQALFGEEGEMLDSYPVREEQVQALENAARVPLDLDSYDYFVDGDAA